MCSISYCQQQMNTFKYQNIGIDIQYEGRLVVKEREREEEGKEKTLQLHLEQ